MTNFFIIDIVLIDPTLTLILYFLFSHLMIFENCRSINRFPRERLKKISRIKKKKSLYNQYKNDFKSFVEDFY